MRVLLLSTYDLGHQPFGLASPAAWLREAGASVTCNDLAVEALNERAVREASLIAMYVPMHTATRLASALVARLRALNPSAHLCFYGLYAPLNADHLRAIGAETLLGGEFENGLVHLYERLSATGVPSPGRQEEPAVSLTKQRFRVPDREGLPPLSRYAHAVTGTGERRVAGYTEASRGCKHLCRHCPVVPVYGGRFRIVQREVVLEDVRRQVAAGARHITFGDPDFFNGVGHALRLVRALHAEFPHLTYDATIKVEHLLKHSRHLPTLVGTGCLFVTTAAEALDDRVLALLRKGHTRSDFLRAVGLARGAGLTVAPTFIPFTPWTTLEGYVELLRTLVELDLVDAVAPIQLALRLLVPRGSLLLDVPEMHEFLGDFDRTTLSYRWVHPDPRVDRLHERVRRIVEEGERNGASGRQTFARIWRVAHGACDLPSPSWTTPEGARRLRVPRLSEPWFCCAEPAAAQFARL